MTIELQPTAEAVPAARAALRAVGGLVTSDVLADARLLVSELVTNSVRHADLGPEQRIEVLAGVEAGTLRVEVRDGGRGFVSSPRVTGSPADSGWGLFLVAQLADRWGVRSDAGTVVWFEIAADRAQRRDG
jgi:anti-sigma regulatory factor (Ser/Thr protein kinase)